MTESDNDHPQAGTVAPARLRKAACGIRFDEDELQEGIDFSAAADLMPERSGDKTSVRDKQRKQDGHS